jgi:hypothetical protein
LTCPKLVSLERKSKVANVSPSLYEIKYRELATSQVNLLGVDSSLPTSLTRFSLDEEVDKEEDGKESSERNGEVGSELDLKSNSVGGEALNNRVQSECRGRSESGNGQSSGGKGSLSDCSNQ